MDSRLYDGADVQTPLFGEQHPRDRALNIVISVVAVLIVLSTLLSAVFYQSSSLSRVLNVSLALVVLMVCGGNIMLVWWYRQGDVDPKFRKLIYFNAITIILLCVCADFYIFKDNCSSKT